MQRIAFALTFIALLAQGCATPGSTRTANPPPEPITSTGRPPAVAPQAKPVRPQRQELNVAGLRLRPWEWAPPGGLQRGRWKTIVIHHSASPKATPQGMDSWHRIGRGWVNGLGYHFVIGGGVNYPDGEIFVGPRWKQQIQGAHCASTAGRYFGLWRDGGFYNDHGIGICLIGDFENGQPTPKQMAALQQLVSFLEGQTGIDPSNIYGHGEVTHKTQCPGRYMNIAGLRRSLVQLHASAE